MVSTKPRRSPRNLEVEMRKGAWAQRCKDIEDEMMDVQSDHGDQLDQEAGHDSLEPKVPRPIGEKAMFTSRGPDGLSKE